MLLKITSLALSFMEGKVTKDTTLAEILMIPAAKEVLAKYNLPCLGCPLAKYEMDNLKIGDVCKMYGIDLGNLLKELNGKLK